jgi:preprotein translocase SecE subunit
MNTHQRLVSALYVLAGGLTWLISSHYTEYFVGYFQLGRKIGVGADVVTHGLPLLLAAGVMIWMKLNTKVSNFCTDAMQELTKVQFPRSKEIRFGTLIVILTVVLAGTFLGLADMAFNAIVKTVIGA